MERKLVSQEHPVSIHTEVFPEYLREGIAIDCWEIILPIQGEATLMVNFQPVRQHPGNITLLYPGDVVMIKEISDDFNIKYLVFHETLGREALSGLPDMCMRSISSANHGLDNPQIVKIVEGMLSAMTHCLEICTPKELALVAASQLRSFFTLWQAQLVKNGVLVSVFRKRKDELFFKFISRLAEDYKIHRDVSHYADALNITPRYLSDIARAHTGSSAKETIDRYTVTHLCQDLRDSDRLVSEIAWDYEFSTLAFFSEYFKRHTDMTPQEYRRAHVPIFDKK